MMTKDKRRSYKELQKRILRVLRTKKLNKNEIARKINAEWRVVGNQIVLLRGNGLVDLFFEHEKMSIFNITDRGLKYLRKVER